LGPVGHPCSCERSFTYAHIDADGNTNNDANSYSDVNIDSNPDRNIHADCNTHCDGYPETQSYSSASSHAGAPAVDLCSIDSDPATPVNTGFVFFDSKQ
jgi:hypothetical protein